jgi:hypothetical protein
MDYSMLRFRRSLQALAAPADIQLQLIPDYLWGVDEIAIEFDQWYQVMKRRRTIFSKKQRSILEDLNKKLDEISGPENLRYWMEDTVRNDIAWEDIRLLAKNALDAMGWPLEDPLKKRSKIPGTISYGE